MNGEAEKDKEGLPSASFLGDGHENVVSFSELAEGARFRRVSSS